MSAEGKDWSPAEHLENVARVKVGVREPKEWIGRIENWLSGKKDVFYLSSCKQPDAGDLGSYELLAAVGIKRQIIINTPDEVDWSALRHFSRQATWKFFVISYDFRRSIHPRTDFQSRDEMGWPLLVMVEPEHVVALTKQGELEIVSAQAPKLLGDIEREESHRLAQVDALRHGASRNSMTSNQHAAKVNQIKQQISQGNLYEMNLCMETVVEEVAIADPLALHFKLLDLSPTPFSSYVQLGAMHLLSASPERYLKKARNLLYSQPIKGTSRRDPDPELDQQSKNYLRNSLKERAEHVMIVDLVRNDLGRICKPGSIGVDELFGIYGYRQVYQMISTIKGECAAGVDFLDAVLASFPMGSMTGAPKTAVMDFIDEIEPTARGWYSGSVGYIQPNGDFDANVVIRSILYDSDKRKAKYAVGGAITFDSDPQAEYEECLLKSSAIRQLFAGGIG